jgi:threonine-phosphate decarboxylase
MIQGHGGNIYAMARHLGCRPDEIIDMSSNINPLGMPPGLSAYLHDHLDRVGALPEVDGRTAIKHMAGLLGVDARRILAGNGTTQFIYSACPALNAQKVLIVGPTYADYEDACLVHHIKPRFLLANADTRFAVNLDLLDQALDGVDTVFICNPNNPTGRLIPHDRLVRLCRAHPESRFIIDESYLPFVPADQSQSMSTCQAENISVLWSISKIFGAPGLRAGFLIAGEATVARFRRFMQPWSLNSLAQAAMDYLGNNPAAIAEFIEKSRRILEKERRNFFDALVSRAQLTLYPSVASYILIRLPEGSSADGVCAQMAQKRLLIRNCRNFHGLSDRFVRVALKDSKVNHLAANYLAEFALSSMLSP